MSLLNSPVTQRAIIYCARSRNNTLSAKSGDSLAKSIQPPAHNTLFSGVPSINGSDHACAYLSGGEVFSVFGTLHVRNILRLPTGTYAPLLRRAFTTLPADWMGRWSGSLLRITKVFSLGEKKWAEKQELRESAIYWEGVEKLRILFYVSLFFSDAEKSIFNFFTFSCVFLRESIVLKGPSFCNFYMFCGHLNLKIMFKAIGLCDSLCVFVLSTNAHTKNKF